MRRIIWLFPDFVFDSTRRGTRHLPQIVGRRVANGMPGGGIGAVGIIIAASKHVHAVVLKQCCARLMSFSELAFCVL